MTQDSELMVFHFTWDGASFRNKFNPHDQARAPENMESTTKGSHKGTGGRVAHLICAIAYGKGTVLAEQYFGNLSFEKFADFVHEHFSHVFARRKRKTSRL